MVPRCRLKSRPCHSFSTCVPDNFLRTLRTAAARPSRLCDTGRSPSRHVPNINIPIRSVRTALTGLSRNATSRRIRNLKSFVARQKLMVYIHLGYSAIAPVQCIENQYGRLIRFRNERLQKPHHRFAQQPGVPVSLPRIRLFQRALLPRLPAIRVTHTLAIPERMLIMKEKAGASFMPLTFPSPVE